ncbi:hypothetical protein [Roseivirga sp. E12]|uniref:hypothetical protein n=1 Tax=Roseivirga sp. E12 TaxID=2819237 RepID=UPI001ABC2FB1|nr:hypothetical protein [Roseivirga sp. E12]MBO3700262.1 hypothetical protein [Roseivirga sp. E12]
MKGSTYLKYAIGEIFLVVVGILIALSLNSWSERLKENKKEKLTIEILSDEISKNMGAMSEDFLNNNLILDSLTLYLKGELIKTDAYAKAQFISYVLNYNWGILEYPTLEQELGPSRIIKNAADLNSSFKDLNAAHLALDFQLNYLNELFNNQTVPFLLEAGAGTGLINTMFQFNSEVPNLSRLYGTEALNNILSIQQLFLFSYNNRIKRLIDESNETLVVLKEL